MAIKEVFLYSWSKVWYEIILFYFSLEVEPMYHESDHIHIIAITKQTGIKVRIQYLDRGGDNEATAHDFPEETDCPDVHLLYRPGHYDILYLKN